MRGCLRTTNIHIITCPGHELDIMGGLYDTEKPRVSEVIHQFQGLQYCTFYSFIILARNHILTTFKVFAKDPNMVIHW